MRLQAEDDAITAQNDAIWGLIAPFLANQIARITIDFKMSIINTVTTNSAKNLNLGKKEFRFFQQFLCNLSFICMSNTNEAITATSS